LVERANVLIAPATRPRLYALQRSGESRSTLAKLLGPLRKPQN
jgi:hypothetical protein